MRHPGHADRVWLDEALDVTEDTQRPVPPTAFVPPRRLCADRSSPHWHPSCASVGVRVDGEEITDCWEYDQDWGMVRRGQHGTMVPVVELEVYVRRPESRQERRARERWERKHARD